MISSPLRMLPVLAFAGAALAAHADRFDVLAVQQTARGHVAVDVGVDGPTPTDTSDVAPSG